MAETGTPEGVRAPEPAKTVNTVRAEVAQRVQAAKNVESKPPILGEETKDTIGAEVKQLLLEVKHEAGEVREHLKEQKAAGLTDTVNKKKAEKVKLAMAQVMEGVKQGVIKVPSDNNKHLITKLDEKIGLSMSDASASPIYPLLEKLVTSPADIPWRELRADFEQLKQYYVYNPTAFHDIHEAIIDAARDGIIPIGVRRAQREFDPNLPTPEPAKAEELAKTEEPASDESAPEPEPTPEPEEPTEPAEPDAERAEDEQRESELERLMGRHGRERYSKFEEDWKQYYSSYFDDSEQARDREVIGALYDVNDFAAFVSAERVKIIEKLTAAGKPANEDVVGRMTSEQVELEIVLRFGKMLAKVNRAHPSEFMEEIERRGFPDNIESVRNKLINTLDNLSNKIALEKDLFKELKFYRRFVEVKMGEKQIDTGEEIVNPITGKKEKGLKTVMQHKMIPVAGLEEITGNEFIKSIQFQATNDYETQSFLQNGSVVFQRGASADKGGFWGQIAGYAEQKMRTVTMDNINYLPDNKIFLQVRQLYEKYIFTEFGITSWTHLPGMFENDFSNRESGVVQKVRESIKMIHPELLDEGQLWRLDRAMNMGVGLSRLIALTEPKLAAWADVHHRGKGESSFVSYYSNDNAALTALNPQHHFDRWKNPAVNKGALMFLRVAGLRRRDLRFYNHEMLWEDMIARNKSYVNGEKAYDEQFGSHKKKVEKIDKKITKLSAKRDKVRTADGKKKVEAKIEALRHERGQVEKPVMLIDYVVNIGKVGSLVDRGGWRNVYALDGWLIRDEKGEHGKMKGDVDVFESWKALENIGIHAVDWFMKEYKINAPDGGGHGHGGGHGGGGHEAEHKGPKHGELYKYLFDKYIPHKEGETFEDYYKNIESDNGVYMSRVLAHMYRERIPTRFITIERDRLSKDGERAVEKLRKQTGWDFPTMRQSLQDLSLVELQVRSETSADMHEQIRDQRDFDKKADPDLSKVILKKDYKVDEARVREILTKNFEGREDADARIKNAVELFQKIDRYYDTDGFLEECAEKIRTNGKNSQKPLPFTVYDDELDTSFMAYNNAGPTVLKRNLGDTAQVEQKVTNELMHGFMDKLHDMAINGKHDHHEIIHALHEIKHTIESIHGEELALEVADHLARIPIFYFKKDWANKNLLTKFFTLGKPHSLAGRFASGSWKGVWEWEVADIDRYLLDLDKANILPQMPVDLMHVEGVERKKLFGLIPYGKDVIHGHQASFSIDRLRKDMGATYADIATEYFSKYGPLVIGFLLYSLINRARKELGGKKH